MNLVNNSDGSYAPLQHSDWYVIPRELMLTVLLQKKFDVQGWPYNCGFSDALLPFYCWNVSGPVNMQASRRWHLEKRAPEKSLCQIR